MYSICSLCSIKKNSRYENFFYVKEKYYENVIRVFALISQDGANDTKSLAPFLDWHHKTLSTAALSYYKIITKQDN